MVRVLGLLEPQIWPHVESAPKIVPVIVTVRGAWSLARWPIVARRGASALSGVVRNVTRFLKQVETDPHRTKSGTNLVPLWYSYI